MPKTTSIKLSIKTYNKLWTSYQKHQKTLEEMGIDSFSKYFQWTANEGLPLVEAKLKKIES